MVDPIALLTLISIITMKPILNHDLHHLQVTLW